MRPATSTPDSERRPLARLLAAGRAVTALVALALVAAGCDYSVNDDVGPPGPPGRDGRDADVSVFTFAFDGGDLAVAEDGLSAFAQVEVDALTLDFVDFGVVLAYADGGLLRESDAGVTWTALPITLGEQADDDIDVDYTVTYSYSYEVGFFYFDVFASEPLSWEEFPLTDVRVVLIPGGDVIETANVDASDYAAVAQALDLDARPAVGAAVRPAAEATRGVPLRIAN